ncbi:MAG: tRNA pseudouridine(38-40) synthase TruA [Bacteroidetes bacterium]|nr:tRNA pseudouridine(38-40) synthase TruA [Bacteroidota bacterium]
MKRFSVQIAYKGTQYYGWQRQLNQPSVQACIEDNLSKLFDSPRIPISGCGRTDTGVHAQDYFFHVDLSDDVRPEFIHFKLNRMLPEDIAVHSVKEVDLNWHARFDARNRTYRYFIHTEKAAFKNETSWHYTYPFSLEKMNEAAEFLIGKQDFTSLSKIHTDVKTNICVVSSAKWFQVEDSSYYFEISANRFLRNMVRATVGTLLDVGKGKLEPAEIKAILEAKDRSAASLSVPAHGLFLWKIDYPEKG